MVDFDGGGVVDEDGTGESPQRAQVPLKTSMTVRFRLYGRVVERW